MVGQSSRRDGRRWPWWLRAAPACVLVGLAIPYLSEQILNPGPFPRCRGTGTRSPLPGRQVARNPALVVPGDAHGEYLWGDPIDDPLVALGTSPWAERSLVPVRRRGRADPAATAETAFESGEQVPGLAAYLERAGIGYVVVRNDLDPGQIGYTSPSVVHRTLALSGFTRVASFGPLITGAQTDPPRPRHTGDRAGLPGGRGLHCRDRALAQPGHRAAGQPDRAGRRGS